MGKTFFGFAVSDSMFSGDVVIRRTVLTVDEVREIIAQGVEPCLNPSHVATIQAMGEKFGLMVEIPATPARVALNSGDSIVVMQARGLPRLTDRHEYTESEVAGATFSFAEWRVE